MHRLIDAIERATFRLRRLVVRRGQRSGQAHDPDAEAAARYWDEALAAGGKRTWMAEERCRFAINRRISGSPHEWPMDWFIRGWSDDRIARGLSLGCGDGALERDVLRKGVCDEIVGLDIAEEALRIARDHAATEGLAGIRYVRGDFNRLALARRHYDIVFFHQSLHHVTRLEPCLEQVAASLRSSGVLYLDEYVGPSRDDWSDALLVEAQREYLALPPELRSTPSVPLPIEPGDPSEAVRSSEIMEAVERFFTIEARRDYGGNLLALLHPLIRWDLLGAEEKADLLDRLIAAEDELLAAGAPSYYTVVVARPLSH